MAWMSIKTAEDLERKHPALVAELKARWTAEQAAAAAAAADDEGDEDKEPIEPPPSSEPIAGGEEDDDDEATTTGAGVATGGAASDDEDKEDPMAGSDNSKGAPATTKVGAGASVAAGIEELEARFPDQPAFVLECLRGKLSLGQAVEARNEQLEARVRQLEDELAARDQAEAKLGARPGGAAPIGGTARGVVDRNAARLPTTTSPTTTGKGASGAGGGGGGGGGGQKFTSEDYQTRVAEVMVERNCKRSEAITFVNKNHPELRAAYAAGR